MNNKKHYVHIAELTGQKRDWHSCHICANQDLAQERAIKKWFGRNANFWQSSNQPSGYGVITEPCKLDGHNVISEPVRITIETRS